MSGRFILVELEEDLAACRTTRRGVWACLTQLPGVRGVVDLTAISMETLATFLLSDEDVAAGFLAAKRKTTSPDHVVRAYWKRVRQPKLDLEP